MQLKVLEWGFDDPLGHANGDHGPDLGKRASLTLQTKDGITYLSYANLTPLHRKIDIGSRENYPSTRSPKLRSKTKMPMKEMEDRILRAMKRLNRPLTVKNIASELNVSGQSVRNYLPRLINSGRVEIYSKRMIEGATAYVLTDESTANFNPITWTDGDMIPVREVFMKLDKSGFSKNPYWQNIEMIIARLYTHALEAVDENDPQTVSALKLREYRVRLEKLREHAKNLVESTTDLLEFDEIWNPRTMPSMLVINDTKLDIEKARDILDRLS